MKEWLQEWMPMFVLGPSFLLIVFLFTASSPIQAICR